MKYPQLVSGRAVSGVSDWLSAELEALGIDGPLYSRLLLSLLHRPLQINVLDLVELHCVNRDREGRRARKRSRPPGSTVTGGSEGVWLNTKAYIKGSHWDPDILKRCAAVECLRTASDQKSDIEKLVDELCAKLREIENESSSLDSLGDCPKTQQKLVETVKNPHDSIISPTELANKYYAAFPALSDSEITFYPSCHSSSVWSAPIKKNISNLEKKHFDKKAKMWKETDMDKKQKPITKKAKSKGVSRRSLPPQWDTVWELGNEELLREYINNQCNVRGQREEGNNSLKIEDNRRLYERDLDDVHFNQEWILEDDIKPKLNSETDMDKMSVARFEAKFNENVEALWKDTDDNSDQLKDNECSIDELNVPVDIQDLLSSPSDLLFEETINKQAKPRSFIQAGTNIINSIWSDNIVLGDEDAGENLCEKSFYPTKNSLEAAAEYKLEMARSFWENSEIETKELNYKKSELKNEFKSVPWQINFSINDLVKSKWSDDVIETQPFLSLASLSSKYQILNHNRELSDFHEVIPRSVSHSATKTSPSEDIFPRPIGAIEDEEPEEDLLNSDRTHFKPIKDEIYADGTTFEVSNSLAKVNYTRSKSGTLSLVTEHETKQYMIYRTTIPDFLYDDLNSSGNDSVIRKESVLAFCVKQIEKSCQTDDEMVVNNPYAIPENKVMKMEPIGGLRKREEYQFPRNYSIDDEKLDCGCNRYYKCLLHKKQLDNYDDEVDMPNFDNQNWCNKCCNNNNNNNIWRDQWFKNEANTGGMENLQQIWSNRVNCETCSIDMLSNDKKHYQELKKELSRDGEEIMSDLNYMQSLYIGSDWADDDTSMEDDGNQDLATSEAAYDVNKVITNCHQIFQQFKPTKTDNPLNANYIFGNKESSVVVIAPPAAPPESEQWKSGSDRKRRHSSSQRPCNEAVSAECKKPHCKFSHETAALPCPLWGDSWDQYEGECGGLAGCQYQHLICPRPLTR